MVSSLAARGQVIKLARELGVDPVRLKGLERADPGDLARVRHAVTRLLYDELRPVFRRIAKTGALLPASIAARVATSALGPFVSGRVASEVEPERAVAMAEHMDDAFLAEVCVYLDAERAGPVIRAFGPARARGVTRHLVASEEHVTMAHLLDAVDDGTVRAVLPVIEDETDLLEAALHVEDLHRLDDIIAMLDNGRVRGLVKAAADSPHRVEATVMLAQLDADTRERFANQTDQLDLDDRARLRAALRGGTVGVRDDGEDDPGYAGPR